MTDTRVYIEDELGDEIEVDMDSLGRGVDVGVYISGPRMGEEIWLSLDQIDVSVEKYEMLVDKQ